MKRDAAHWGIPHPLILGHRGSPLLYPENTPRSFLAAIAAGADGVEFDVQKNIDGRYVVVHNPPRGILGFEAPGLIEVLEALPREAYLDVELKADTLSPADSPRILEILQRNRETDRIMISSFDLRLLPFFRQRGIVTGLLVNREFIKNGMARFYILLFRLRPRFVNLPIQALSIIGERKTKAIARALRFFGFSLAFWTVNRAEDAQKILRFARVIITDDVPTIKGYLDGKSANP